MEQITFEWGSSLGPYFTVNLQLVNTKVIDFALVDFEQEFEMI